MRPTSTPLAPLREMHPGQTLAQAMGYSLAEWRNIALEHTLAFMELEQQGVSKSELEQAILQEKLDSVFPFKPVNWGLKFLG